MSHFCIFEVNLESCDVNLKIQNCDSNRCMSFQSAHLECMLHILYLTLKSKIFVIGWIDWIILHFMIAHVFQDKCQRSAIEMRKRMKMRENICVNSCSSKIMFAFLVSSNIFNRYSMRSTCFSYERINDLKIFSKLNKRCCQIFDSNKSLTICKRLD